MTIGRRAAVGLAVNSPGFGACCVTRQLSHFDSWPAGTPTPNNRLNVAIIGAGGRGGAAVQGMKDKNVVASRAGKGHFADHLIAALARAEGCRTTYTFEKGLGPSAGFTQL